MVSALIKMLYLGVFYQALVKSVIISNGMADMTGTTLTAEKAYLFLLNI